MTNGEIRRTFINLSQATTTQAQVIGIQAQDIATQVNWEVSPYVNQNASTMSSRLRDCTMINPQMFFGFKVNEDLHELLD